MVYGMSSSFTRSQNNVQSCTFAFYSVFHFCFCSESKVIRIRLTCGMIGLVPSLKLFIKRFSEKSMEKMNGKFTSGTRAVQKGGGHCYALLA